MRRILSMGATLTVLLGGASGFTPAHAESSWRLAYLHPEVPEYDTRLERVAALNQNDVWATGSTTSVISAESAGIVKHWDGQSWKDVETPVKTGWSGPVAASSASNVWVFGPEKYPATGYTAMRWNGYSWKTTSLGQLSPWDAAVLGKNDVWVVGASRAFGGDEQEVRAKHWNGTDWVHTPMPDIPFAVSAVSKTDVWAVGDRTWEDQEELGRVSVMRWRGELWRRVKIPKVDLPPGEESGVVELRDVAALSADNVWAVGKIVWNPPDGDGPLRTLLLRWNGKKWSVQIGDDKQDEFYMHVAPDGAGGVWMTTSSGAYVHHTRDGEVTRVEAPIPEGRRWGPNLHELANVPETRSMVAVGDYQPASDGDQSWDATVHTYGTSG